MSAARPSVVELRVSPRDVWWVHVLSPDEHPARPGATWRWARKPSDATVFPTRRDAARFRVDHCLRYLSGYERRSTRVRDADLAAQ